MTKPTTKKDKLRISYSLLNMWRRGRITDAINSYLHISSPTSRAMEEGIMWDQTITEWIDLYQKLPDEFGGDELKSAKTQERFEIPYSDIGVLVIVPDIIDLDTLWENKTGSSKDSSDYAQDFQISMYFLGLELAGIKITKAIINHYNQHTDKLDRTLVWNNEQEIKRARNFIDSISPEIYQYFQENGIFEKEKELLDKKHEIV